MVGFIPIYKGNSFVIKIVIYHQTIIEIIKNKYNNKHWLDKLLDMCFENYLDITLLKNGAIENLLIMCINKNI